MRCKGQYTLHILAEKGHEVREIGPDFAMVEFDDSVRFYIILLALDR